MPEDSGPVVMKGGGCSVVLHPGRRLDPHCLEHLVELDAGAFRGSLLAFAYVDPFVRFRDQLLRLYETLTGKATLESYENFELSMTGTDVGTSRSRWLRGTIIRWTSSFASAWSSTRRSCRR